MSTDTTRRLLAGTATALSILGFCGGTALAADGDLDTTFGTDGIGRLVAAQDGASTAHDVAIDAQGRTVLAGHGRTDDGFLAVGRLGTDGKPDASFGDGGVVRTTVGSGGHGRGVAIQGNGRIVVAGDGSDLGEARHLFGVARYLDDGSLDTSFGGGDGLVETGVGDFPGASGIIAAAEDVALAPGGKIVVAGWGYFRDSMFSNRTRFIVARYLEDGELDATFSGDGIADVNVTPDNSSQAFAVAVQPDGKVVLGGVAFESEGDFFAVARLDADGTLDEGFGPLGNGIVKTDVAPAGTTVTRESKLESLAIDGAGRIVAAGTEDSDGPAAFAAARYASGGELDAGFGTGGVMRTQVSGWSEAHDVVALGDGSMVMAGGANDARDIGLARLSADGTLAEGFGTGGKVVTQVPDADSEAYAVAAGADGRSLVVGGEVGQDMGAARYTVVQAGGGTVDPVDGDTGDEEPKKDEPKKDEPKKDEPRKDEPKKEAAKPQRTVAPAPVAATPALVRAQPVPRRCLSRRLFAVNPTTLGLSGAKVTAVGRRGRRATVSRTSASRHRIDLRRLPGGSYSVRVTGRTKHGRIRTVTKTYRTCA